MAHFIRILGANEAPLPIDGKASLYYALLNEKALPKCRSCTRFDKVAANLYY
jgi:hypothetical protein